MIYSYGATNFYSFKEGLKVSFELNSKVPKQISGGRKYAPVLGIKGANASGKTQLLKALSFISTIATRSFSFDVGERLGYSRFFQSKKTSSFYVDFESRGVRYVYEFTTDEYAIVKEALYKKLSRKTKLFERDGSTLIYRTADLAELDLIEFKENASVISTASKYKFKSSGVDLANVYDFLKSIRGNVASFGVIDNPRVFSTDFVSKFYYDNPDALDFAVKLIKKADLGISGVKIHERGNPTPDGEKEYMPIFAHATDHGTEFLTSWDQSSGTMALFRRLWIYWVTISSGGVLVLDEFDVNCHSMLLPLLIELFLSNEDNPLGAQFIFTAHSSDVIDMLGKYRTLLVNKESGESYCYRLDEIPGDLIRNDRSIAALYREGKIGGVPRL